MRISKQPLNISILNTEKIIKRWQQGENDAFFLYFESDNALDFFQFFNPRSNFTLGVPGDHIIVKMIKDFTNEIDSEKKNLEAIRFAKHIQTLKTVFPIFSPKQYLSKKYHTAKTSTQSPQLKRFADLIRKEFR